MRTIALLILAAVIALTVPASAGPPTYYGYFESPGGGSTDGLTIPTHGLAFGQLYPAELTQSTLTDCQGLISNGMRLSVNGSPAFVSNQTASQQAACGDFFASAMVAGQYTLSDGWSFAGNLSNACAGITDTNGYEFVSTGAIVSQVANASGGVGFCHPVAMANTLNVTGTYTSTSGSVELTNGDFVGPIFLLGGAGGSGYAFSSITISCAGISGANGFDIANLSPTAIMTGNSSANVGFCGNTTAAGTVGGGGASGWSISNPSGTTAQFNGVAEAVTTATTTPGPLSPCFTANGSTCSSPGTQHHVQGHVSTTINGNCSTLTECATVIISVTLSNAAVFTSQTTYECSGNDADHNILLYVTPVSGTQFTFGFFNSTNSTIAGGSNVDLLYNCEGY
jgi:hypothetical protein